MTSRRLDVHQIDHWVVRIVRLSIVQPGFDIVFYAIDHGTQVVMVRPPIPPVFATLDNLVDLVVFNDHEAVKQFLEALLRVAFQVLAQSGSRILFEHDEAVKSPVSQRALVAFEGLWIG